jgi:hypothetical protein
MHTKTVNLPAGSVFDIYVEKIRTKPPSTNTHAR